MKKLTKKAHAKINLALDVLGKRPNGYHDVRMIMQSLTLCDELTFEAEEKDKADGYEIIIKTDAPNVPTDERNLIYKAAKLLMDEYGLKAKLTITLEKNIPVEAGMAGGSTDCAATLKAVNELFSLGLDEKKLMEYGVRLGADVPFCIMGKAALSEGIGEILTPVKSLPACFVLIAKPKEGVSTRVVYEAFDSTPVDKHPDVDGMLVALEKEDLKLVSDCMYNVLELVTAPMLPLVGELEEMMLKNGAINSVMTGSGPTVFGIFSDYSKAWECMNNIKNVYPEVTVHLTKPV